MEFTGTINEVGLNTFIDASTVVLRLENGTDIEIIVSKFMAKTLAHKLYQKAGYVEIGRIPDFTFWQDKMWEDIRMEKY
jgi:hypothetical protein